MGHRHRLFVPEKQRCYTVVEVIPCQDRLVRESEVESIETLEYYKMISNYMLYGYCLMDNHIHLLIRENEESISQVVKRISSSYHEYTGTPTIVNIDSALDMFSENRRKAAESQKV